MGRKISAKQKEEIDKIEKVKQILNINSKTLEKKREVVQEPLINEIENYRSYFIRDDKNFTVKTKSKDRQKQLKELVRHVFNKYVVPDFMFEAWSNSNNAIRKQYDFKKWYICLGTGGSLYKEITKDFLTKKETHIFVNCGHGINIQEALVYAIAKAECMNDGIALRISKTKINDIPLNEFWKENIRWFSKNTPSSINEINDLVDYLIAKKRENAQFTLMGAGFTLQSLTKKMHDWHYDLRRLKAIGTAQWEGHPLNDDIYAYKDQNGVEYHWYFYQIKSSKELQEEGNAQRHCVFSYKDSCLNGGCSIWSLRLGFAHETAKQAKRKVTIELRNDGSIVQARGLANRKMRSDEAAIVSKWAKDNGLYLSSYI